MTTDIVTTLIVDDSPDARAWLKIHLERIGCGVIGEAANAAEGLERFESLNPRLITLDILMPDVEGMTAMDLFKKVRDADTRTAVLVVSVRPMSTSKEFLSRGAIGYLEKPFVDFDEAEILLKAHFPELSAQRTRAKRPLSSRLGQRPANKGGPH